MLTMAHALAQWAELRPSDVAYRYLGDGEEVTATLTFAELFRAAQRLSQQLRATHAPASRIALIYPPGLEFVVGLFGCMLAGVVAVPIPPPRRGDRAERVRELLRAADPASVLTTRSFERSLIERLSADSVPPVVAMDASGPSSNGPSLLAVELELEAETLALLQFTSGSTSDPKGVMLTHGHLIENQRMIQSAFQHDQSTTTVGWLPLFHDMGLIGNVMQPLFLGRPCTLLPAREFLQKPERWLRAISRFRATTSGAPNFAYDFCVDRIRPETLEDVDLSSWRVAYNGSERVRAETIDRFAAAFASSGFRRDAFLPCYGMAEATLLVSGGPGGGRFSIASAGNPERSSNEAKSAVVGCGRPAPHVRVRIVDPLHEVTVPEGQIGEIWVSAPSVAAGYWRGGVETGAGFHARLPGESASYLRTGDLGFLDGEELFVTGRRKELIIIRGRNHHPQDIERIAQDSHPALARNLGAAFSVEERGVEEVVLVQEVLRTAIRGLNVGEIGDAVRAAVASGHGLRIGAIVLLRPGSLERTTSGKIRRVPVRNLYRSGNIPEERILGFVSDPDEVLLPPTVCPVPESSSKDAREVVEWLRDYAETRIDSRQIDERRVLPPHIVLDFGNRGLFGLQAPLSVGGLGLGHADMLRIIEQLGAIDQTLCLLVGVHNVLGLGPILRHARPEKRDALLADLASGRKLASFALTEAGAGSNPKAIQAEAKPVVPDAPCDRDAPDGPVAWRLYGSKVWTGLGAWASAINVFVRTEGSFSGFTVSQGAPGLRQGEEALTMGMRGIIQNSIQFEGVSVGHEDQLGEIGQGMAVAQEAMNHGRLVIAASCIGGMKRVVQIAVRYASRRQIATGRLIDNPVTLDRLNGLLAATRSLETLVYEIARCLDQGKTVPEELFACCKILGPELFWEAADALVQFLGGRGYIETNLAPQMLRDARVLRIFEGPTETLCDLLGARAASKPEHLLEFLRSELHAPDSVAQLSQFLEEVSSHPGDVGALSASLRVPFGETIAYAVLVAAAESSNRDDDEAALDWARSVFEEKRRTFATRVNRKMPTLARVLEQIDSFAADIGNIEQSTPGEDHQLDPMLRRADLPEARSRSENGDVERPRAVESPSDDLGPGPSIAEVRDWLQGWLARRLKTVPSRIDGDSSFAALGVDSLTAVELASELGAWLGRSLDDTFLWDFPTLDQAAAHLSGSAGISPEGDPSHVGTSSSREQTLSELRQELDDIERALESQDEA